MTCDHTAQQNGLAERIKRTLLDITGNMMVCKNVSNDFWDDAVVAADLLRNRATIKAFPRIEVPSRFGLV